MNRFVIVKKDSALPCSQSTFAKIVPYFTLAAAHSELLLLLLTDSERNLLVWTLKFPYHTFPCGSNSSLQQSVGSDTP